MGRPPLSNRVTHLDLHPATGVPTSDGTIPPYPSRPQPADGDASDAADATASPAGQAAAPEDTRLVHEPGRLLRTASMLRTVLEETRSDQLDEAARSRVQDVISRTVATLKDLVPAGLAKELCEFAADPDPDRLPSGPELRVAAAEVVGWIDGLIQSTAMGMGGDDAAPGPLGEPDYFEAASPGHYL